MSFFVIFSPLRFSSTRVSLSLLCLLRPLFLPFSLSFLSSLLSLKSSLGIYPDPVPLDFLLISSTWLIRVLFGRHSTLLHPRPHFIHRSLKSMRLFYS